MGSEKLERFDSIKDTSAVAPKDFAQGVNHR